MKKLSEEEMFKIHFQHEVTEVEYANDGVELLYDADPNCNHDIKAEWSGIKCTKCSGWFCY